MRNKLTLEKARMINGGKVELTFTQVVETEKKAKNILGMLNASDERFNVGNPNKTMAWVSAVPSDAEALFGIDFSSLENVGDEMELNVVEPKINGELLNIQIKETTKGSDWDFANLEKSAKRAGKDGDFIMTADSEYIFRKASVVAGEPQHYIMKETVRQSATDEAIANAIG